MAELQRRTLNASRDLQAQQLQAYSPVLPPEPEAEDGPSLPEEYFNVLMRHKLLIGGLAFAGLVLSALLTFTTQPMYRTRTSLSIQSLNSDFMNMKSVDPTAGTPVDIVVQTQIKLLESESLAERVKKKLERAQHPDAITRKDLLSSLKQVLHLGRVQTIPFRQILEETAKNVKVKPLGITQMVEITCDSWDPAFAVQYCNTLTGEFQEEDLENRGTEAKRTSDWLMHQASDIRQKAEESQHRLEAATGGNGLILGDAGGSVGTDALRSLQAELVKAQADRMEKEAEIAGARVSSADMMPRSAQSSTYLTQKSKLLDLQQQVSALVPPLTEENPRVIHLRQQIRELQTSLDRETSDNQGRLLNEYEAAKHREKLLRMSYDAKQGSVSADLQKASEVDLLKREVQSEQQLYQTLLQRAKEAGFASAMQATTIHTVDEARKPLLPVYPRRLTSAGVGVLVGSILGLLLAFFLDRRSNLLQAPGDVTRLLQVEELGVIPSPRALPSVRTTQRHFGLRLVPKPLPRLQEVYADVASEDSSLLAEAYRGLGHSILLADRKAASRVYVVTSPNAGEGKSTVVSHLGVALSHSGRSVVLVDADLRKPKLHEIFQLRNDFGLADVVAGTDNDLGSWPTRAVQQTGYPNLDLLTSGHNRRGISRALHSNRMPVLLESLANTYDVVLIDTPPMLHIADARVLASMSNAAILVVRAGVTTREEARSAQYLFDRDEIPVIGSVLNDFNPGRVGKSSYYKSYYTYRDSMTGAANG